MTCGRGTGASLRSGLAPRTGHLQNAQVSCTVRGVRTTKNVVPTPPSRSMPSVPTSEYPAIITLVKIFSAESDSLGCCVGKIGGWLLRQSCGAIQRRGLSALNWGRRPYCGWDRPPEHPRLSNGAAYFEIIILNLVTLKTAWVVSCTDTLRRFC